MKISKTYAKDSLSTLKPLMRLAWPVIIGQLGQITMHLVDNIVVGRLGAAQLGAVGLGAAFYYVALMAGIGVLLGQDFLVAYAFGARRLNHARRIHTQAYISAFILGALLTLTLIFISHHLNWFGSDPTVIVYASPYLEVLSYSLIPVLIFSAGRQYLQATGKTVVAMTIMILANLVNFGGNIALVYGRFGFPEMGVKGSALATLMARIFMAIAIVVYAAWLDPHWLKGIFRRAYGFHWPSLKKLFHVGSPAALQMIVEVSAFSCATTLASRFSPVSLAAHQVCLSVASFTFMMPLGLSAASSVLVAQNLGRGDFVNAKKVGELSLIVSATIMGFCAVALLAFGKQIISAYTSSTEVILAAKKILFIAGLFQILDGIQITGTGILRGLGKTKISLFANLIGHWCIGVPLGALLAFFFQLELVGIWLGLAAGLATVALLLVWQWNKRTAHWLNRTHSATA